jgi:hypothetical protein
VRDHFETRVERFAQLQHEFNRRLKDFERRAAKKPFFCADEAWENTRGMVGALREQSIDLFGLDVKHYGPVIQSAALESAEEEPKSWEDITPLSEMRFRAVLNENGDETRSLDLTVS